MKFETVRLRELGLMSEQNMYELVKNTDACGGSYIHVKWFQGHREDDVRCPPQATELATGERLDVTQSTPSLMVAPLLLATASLRVNENEV